MKPQATRIEPPQPDESRSELLGCICYGALFVALMMAVCMAPWILEWARTFIVLSI